MLEQSLFGEIALPPSEVKETKAAERKRKAKLAWDATSEKWRIAYSGFVVDYLRQNPPAIAETIRMAYEARRDLPQLVAADKRASGHIFTSLLKQGKIRRTDEYGWSVDRSSPMMKYKAAI